MRPVGLVRLPAVIVAVAASGAVCVGAAGAPARTRLATRPSLAASQTITPKGVGAVRLGSTYKKLRRQRLIGGIHSGCNLSGPSARSAGLRAPLEGSVDFTPTSPRKAANISVSGGATARGVGIGARLADITAAYPQAKVDHTSEAMFGVTLVKIPKNGGGRLQFAVDTKTMKVNRIGIPAIPFCE